MHKEQKNETESNFVAHRFENDRFFAADAVLGSFGIYKKCYRQLLHSKVVSGLKMTEKH